MARHRGEKWDLIYQSGGLYWREPHEIVVERFPEWQRRGFQNVLDLGCGAGRHLVYLSQRGFRVYGLDISASALDEAASWLDEEALPAELALGDMLSLPFRPRCMDVVLCLYTLYHGLLGQVSRTVREIHRVLRPEGLAICTFISTCHDRYGQGQKLEPGTFIPSSGVDAGVPHHFSDRGEIQRLFQDFQIHQLAFMARGADGGDNTSHWVLRAEKR
jgi:SAM-dependent methyltransferase